MSEASLLRWAVRLQLTYAQDLQVWMRTAALPTFRKLYAQINQPLYAGSLVTLDIRNRYNSYAYGGQKSLVISTATWLGGKNSFLGIAYLTVGSICIFLSVVFFILQFTSYRYAGRTKALLAFASFTRGLEQVILPCAV